jgi:uncharacterized protein (TIGR02246 family)
MSTLEDRLRLLEDERDILKTLHAYGYAIDYGHEDEFLDCWTDDAVLYWPTKTMRGRDQLRDAFRAHTHAPAVYHKHVIVEPRVRIDGDRATVESMFARLDAYPEGPQIKSYGRYLDMLVRSGDGRWRFVERRAEAEAMRPPP